MRGPLLVLLLAPLVLVSCLSPQTQLELDQARDKTHQLEVDVAHAEQSGALNLAYLQSELARAKAEQAKVEEKATDEQIENAAGAVEQSASSLGPLLGLVIPGAAAAIGAIGLGAGAIKRKKAAKRKAAGGGA